MDDRPNSIWTWIKFPGRAARQKIDLRRAPRYRFTRTIDLLKKQGLIDELDLPASAPATRPLLRKRHGPRDHIHVALPAMRESARIRRAACTNS